MDNSTLEELIDLYDLAPVADGALGVDLENLTPGARSDLESLAHLSVLLHQTLTPITPGLAFREDLRQSLMATALARQGWRGVILFQLREHWKVTAAAATASGVSVAVGAIGVVAWYRGRS